VIVDFLALLRRCRAERRAVAAFSCYDVETAAGVLRAAAGRPVVLLMPAPAILHPGGDLLAAALRAVAEQAASPVSLQLDHAHGLEEIRAACDCGVGAVMADGSHLSRDANVELVIAARSIAARRGVAVEAALGRLAGDEETALEVGVDADGLTDPAEVRRFVAEAQPDCVAVAIGNVHGVYRDRPRVDLARLRSIAARTERPLALHGGSGLQACALRAAVGAGIAKVNFNTELRQAYVAATRDALPAAGPLALHRAQTAAVATVAAAKFAAVLGPSTGLHPVEAGPLTWTASV
jgi:ketose-bisphosphate aldolase